MRRLLLLALLSVLVVPSCAKKAPERPSTAMFTAEFDTVIPRPAEAQASGGPGFTFNADTRIVVSSAAGPGDEEALRVGRFLADIVGIAAAPQPPVVSSGDAANAGTNVVLLRLGGAQVDGDEAYTLEVGPERVTVAANAPAGLFYGVQTLRQLMPPFIEYGAVRADKGRPLVVAGGRISDRPRYGWRGSMLDVSRHFFTVADVKRYIDLMALHKLNRLHLHLSDDQGWRIEIKSWPNLTVHGGSTQVGGGPGGFYTQDDYVAIVRYAAEHFITVVPEIDMPGHTNAALASYAELNCDDTARPLYTGIQVGFSALCVERETTYRFIDDVVREIAALTPGRWFHIGGDEVKTLKPEQYNAFIERVDGIVRAHGKVAVGWDEVASARLDPASIVQVWRPKTEPGPAITGGAQVIMSIGSRAYLDMKYHPGTAIGLTWAGLIDIRDAYDWDPASVAPGVPARSVAGVEAPLWAETLQTIRDVEFLAYPRLAAIAEVGWTPQARRDWDGFRERLAVHGARLTALGVNFYRSPAIPWRD